MPLSSELCREVMIEPWPRGGVVVDIEADASERRGLARRFDLLELRSLCGHARLERSAGGEIGLVGWLDAEVVQACVISFEPVPAVIQASIRRRYRRDAADRVDHEGLVDDELEPLVGDRIDVGEVLAEELGLALDPYPRAAGAAALVAGELGPDVSFSPAASDDDGPPLAGEQSLAR